MFSVHKYVPETIEGDLEVHLECITGNTESSKKFKTSTWGSMGIRQYRETERGLEIQRERSHFWADQRKLERKVSSSLSI